jgi:hypothetical protein
MDEQLQFDPALKSWLDNAIVPALVQEYLTEMRLGKKFASGVEGELESAVKVGRSLKRNR